MKAERFLSGLTAWILAVTATMGGLLCMTSGLNLEAGDLLTVLIVCCVFTAVCCVFTRFRLGGLSLLLLCILLGSYLYREGTLPLEFESLIYKISQVYDQGYGWGVIRWSGEYLRDVPITQGLCLFACLISGVTAWALCRQKGMLFPLLLCLLPLFSCMVVTDSVPDVIPLFVLLVPVVLMAVTNTVRRRSRADGIRLTALLLIPALLSGFLLFVAVPKNNYDAQLSGMQQTLLSWFRGLPFVMETPDGLLFLSFSGASENEVDLSRIGAKTQLHYAVMDVVSDHSDHLYLRGQAFDTYDGTSWVSSDSADNSLRTAHEWPSSSILKTAGTVMISVRGYRNFRYMPYYPSGTDWVKQIVQGKLTNPDNLMVYSFDRLVLNGELASTTDRISSRYLELPADTRIAATRYIDKHASFVRSPSTATSGYTTEYLANAIGKLVENSATYSLNTDRMPEGWTDFAMWFLEKSDTGYCVHFATAATVLLRALDIPARYVTGYTCEASAGKRVTVTADKAHAWVEYFDREYDCWRIMDPTPAGAGGSGIDRPTFTIPTEPSVTTEPTGPTESTQPPETEPVETLPTEPEFTLPDPTFSDTTEPAPTPGATEPTGGGLPGPGGSSGGSGMDLQKLWETVKPFLLLLAWILGISGILAGQYLLRKRIRMRNMHTGHPNKRALSRWREVCRMADLLKVEPPDKLEQLAEKAKFSQHTLTPGELTEFDAWLTMASGQLQRRNWCVRLLIKLIWAV